MTVRNERAILRSLAVAGVVVGLAFGAAGWYFLGQLDRNLDQSLEIGESASGTLIETIDVAEQLVVALDDGLGTLATTLETVQASLFDTTGVARSTADLAAALPESFDDVDVALRTVESLSGAIDGALRAASRIPLGPDYDPDVSFPEAVGNLRSAFSPIGDDLDAIALELDTFATSSGDVGSQVDAVRVDLVETRRALANTSELLDEYRETAREAGQLARDSRDDMARGFLLARLAVVLLGLFLIVSQFVPWWLADRVATASNAQDSESVRV